MQQLISESNLERDNTIQALRKEMRDVVESYKKAVEFSGKQNNMISDYKGMVDDVNSRYDKLMGLYENLKSKFDTSVSMTKTAYERIDELQNVMRGGLLIKPRDTEEFDRRVKILLQVIPDWRERGASGIVRLTSEEEQKVMESMNQSKVS
jgi:uncharacterized coiled-coil DUF342 family protein